MQIGFLSLLCFSVLVLSLSACDFSRQLIALVQTAPPHSYQYLHSNEYSDRNAGTNAHRDSRSANGYRGAIADRSRASARGSDARAATDPGSAGDRATARHAAACCRSGIVVPGCVLRNTGGGDVAEVENG